MNQKNIIWLASYPRSGNTFLRTILRQCFGLRSASIYQNDLGGNKILEEYVGHIENDEKNNIQFDKLDIPLVKTHNLNYDDHPAIYVIRDGRKAVVSLWQFDLIDDGRYQHGSISLEEIIEGKHERGMWSEHIMSWDPWNRPNTLLLEYEEMVNNLPYVLMKLSEYLNREISQDFLPDRNIIAGIDGRWVKKGNNQELKISDKLMERFVQLNKIALIKGGYIYE